jgi:tight adherence protein B
VTATTLSLMAGGSAAIAVGSVAYALNVGVKRGRVEAQLSRLDDEAVSHAPAAPPTSVLEMVLPTQEGFRKLLLKLPHFRNIESLARQAGFDWSASQYLFRVTAMALIGWMLALILTKSGMVALVGAAICSSIPFLLAHSGRRRRRAMIEEQLADAIDLLARALRAGHPLAAGFRLASQEAPEPIGSELRRVWEEQNFGIPFEESLRSLSRRLDSLDVRMLVTAILIQREVGGNLAGVLDSLADTMRVRFYIQAKVKGYTAQGRLSGVIVSALPAVVAGAVYLMDRDFITILFTHPVGRLMLIFAVVAQFVGGLWIRSIVNVRY